VSPKKPPDSQTVVLLFVAGAALVVAAFAYALVRHWPTFDPLVTATMIGVGLLLIVIYERLGKIHSELRTIAYYAERLATEGRPSTDAIQGRDEISPAQDAK